MQELKQGIGPESFFAAMARCDICDRKVVVITGEPGTGKAKLARDTFPNAKYSDLSRTILTSRDIQADDDRTVIFDKLYAVEPGTVNGQLVRQYGNQYPGMIFILPTIEGIERYLDAVQEIRVFDQDTDQYAEYSIVTKEVGERSC